MQLLQQARIMAEVDSNTAHMKCKECHDKDASRHDLIIGDKVLFGKQCQKEITMWIGPFTITKIINRQNVEVKKKHIPNPQYV